MLNNLNKQHYQAYLVGGGVRDILLGIRPKDFDIATDAKPNQIKKLFKNCRLIGRRFRLAHIFFGRDIIEVATFRAGNDDNQHNNKDHQTDEKGIIKRDNVFGTLEQDAWRRDITVNALYYDITDKSIIDLTGGIADIAHELIRIIGDPITRYTEDPVRMLRVIRFAAKLGFAIEQNTAAPIRAMAPHLAEISNARLFEEVIKLFHCSAADASLNLLLEYDLFQQLFPITQQLILSNSTVRKFITQACLNTNQRIKQGKTVTPAFIFAVMLWHPVQAMINTLIEQEQLPKAQATTQAISVLLNEQSKITSIPKRFSSAIREIWQLQPRLTRPINKRSLSLIEHPRFRAAYDFLLLRSLVEPEHQTNVQWWTNYQAADAIQQASMIREISKAPLSLKSQKKPKKANKKHKTKSLGNTK